jgi:hypothetical protein
MQSVSRKVRCCALAFHGEAAQEMTTAVRKRLMPGDVTTVQFGDREVEAVVVHVGHHSGMVLARTVGENPGIPAGSIICARQ